MGVVRVGTCSRTEQTFVLFNNNKYDHAQRNARRMNELLEDLLLNVPHETEGAARQEPLF